MLATTLKTSAFPSKQTFKNANSLINRVIIEIVVAS